MLQLNGVPLLLTSWIQLLASSSSQVLPIYLPPIHNWAIERVGEFFDHWVEVELFAQVCFAYLIDSVSSISLLSRLVTGPLCKSTPMEPTSRAAYLRLLVRDPSVELQLLLPLPLPLPRRLKKRKTGYILKDKKIIIKQISANRGTDSRFVLEANLKSL